MRGDHERHAELARRFAVGVLGLICFLTIACRRYKFVRTENPQPDIEIRINGSPMIVRSAVLLHGGGGGGYNVLFFTRAVNCDELSQGKDKGRDDAVIVGIWEDPPNITGLTVGGKIAGRTIREPRVAVAEIQESPPSLWPAGLEGTLDVATNTLEIRGKFTARGCGWTPVPFKAKP